MIANKDQKVLITGIAGQDGSYLAELLLNKGYRVVGIDVQATIPPPISGVEYFKGSISDAGFLIDLLLDFRPDVIYNLASVSQVSNSFNIPEETFSVNLLPVIRMLELIRNEIKNTKYLQAISSEIFGGKANPPFNEESALEPLSPYAVSKEAAYHLVKLYRQAYNIYAANAILFNHTSSRHALNFVVPKIVNGLVDIKLGKMSKLRLGDLDIERDWGYAGDYVKAMIAIIEHPEAADFVIGTGKHKSLRVIVEYVLNKLDLSYEDTIEIDKSLFRKNDPKVIYSDPKKIMNVLGWKPEKSLEDILDLMIDETIEKNKEDLCPKKLL